jgi:hypothetical protein
MKPEQFFTLCIALLSSCTTSSTPAPITLATGACSNPHHITIFVQNPPKPYCLAGAAKPPKRWEESRDASQVALAWVDEAVELPPLDGRHGYMRPPALRWYIVSLAGGTATHLTNADNLGVTLSPDGSYFFVHHYCHYEICKAAVFRVKGEEKMCEYSTRAGWYVRSSDEALICTPLFLRSGKLWDFEREINAEACRFYHGEAQCK